MHINKYLKKYLQVFRLAFLQAGKDYKVLLGLSLFLVTCLLIFANLFELTIGKMELVSYNRESLLWYIAMNEWILVALPGLHLLIEEELRTGTTEYQLPRPISYVGAKFATGMGQATANFLFLGIVTTLFTTLWTGISPLSISTICLSYLSLTLGVLFQLLVGLSAFWLQEVGPFQWIFEKFLFVFGGLMLPLSAYPELLRTVATYTPFSVILGYRSMLVFDCDDIFLVTLLLISWSVFAYSIAHIMYGFGLRRINLSGA